MAREPDYPAMTTLTQMFFDESERHPKENFLWTRQGGRYRPLTWGQVADAVVAAARGLRAMGLQDGDRVVLCSENRPEWLIADLAIMAAGGITVPAFTTNTERDHLHILEDSNARAAIVSSTAIARHLLQAAYASGRSRFVVTMQPQSVAQSGLIDFVHWDDLLRRGNHTDDDVRGRVHAAKRSNTACIIYTSGTGGTPKGVMQSHGSILCNCMGAYETLERLGFGREVFLSFLPLSHSYEHTAGQFFPISLGAQIYYAEGAETLSSNMLEARPTIMVAVPRLYETLRARMLRGLEKQPPLRHKLFFRALALGLKRQDPLQRFNPGEWLLDRILDRLVRQSVRRRFGGRLKAMISGGAPLNPDIGLFFNALGLRVLQGYGQTEAAPVISVNPPDKIKMHTVGPAMPGVEVRIAPDGEILVRGELVMQGYWNNPEATAAALADGWLHTGDIGMIDPDGYIRITDRKKDIIVNSGGDNIAPQRIEGFLTLEPEIGQAMVAGDRRPYLVALIVPDAQTVQEWAAKSGRAADPAALCADDNFRRIVGGAVDRVNANLSVIERIRRFALIPDAFTVENRQMTPTLKIRRAEILHAYGKMLDALYEGGQ